MSQETETQFDGNESENAAEPTTFFTRRRLMKGTAGAVGVGALGGLGLWYGTQPSLAATTYEESSGEVIVETNAGEVMDVRVAPTFSLDWTDFGGGVDSFDFDITATVGTDGPTETVYSETGVSAASGDVDSFTIADSGSLDDFDGTVDMGCVTASILGDNITTDSFPTGVAEGTDESADVTLTLSATGNQSIGSAVDADDATQAFTITVNNPAGSATAEITASNAEADGADSADETTTASP